MRNPFYRQIAVIAKSDQATFRLNFSEFCGLKHNECLLIKASEQLKIISIGKLEVGKCLDQFGTYELSQTCGQGSEEMLYQLDVVLERGDTTVEVVKCERVPIIEVVDAIIS